MSHGEFFNGRTYSLEGKLTTRFHEDSRSFSTMNYFYNQGCNLNKEKNKIIERSTYYSSMAPDFPTTFRKIIDNQNLKIGKLNWIVIMG